MSELSGQNNIKQDPPEIRPVVLADLDTLGEYGPVLRRLFVALASSVREVMLIVPPAAHVGPLISPSISLIRYPIYQIPILGKQNREELINRVSKYRPTVVHCFSQGKIDLAKFISRRLDIPYLVTFNSAAQKQLQNRADPERCMALICPNDEISKTIARVYPKMQGLIRKVRLGTFVEDTCACFDDSSHVTSIVAPVIYENAGDFESLLNAAKHLAIDGYEFVMAVIGSGRGDRKLHKMIKTLGLSQIVTIVPEMNPIRSILAGADIYIQGHSTGARQSYLLEAMSVGMVVASCEKSAGEMLIDDQTAVFFDGEDELSIYSCLSKLLDRPQFARSIAQRGQQYLRENNTVSAMNDSLMEIYINAQTNYQSPE